MQLLVFFGIAMASFLVAAYIGSKLITNLAGLGPVPPQDAASWDLSNPAYATYLRGMLLVQFLFLWTVPTLLFSVLADPKAPMKFLGLHKPGNYIYWLLGILVMLVGYPFVEYTGYINQKMILSSGGETWMRELEEQALRQLQILFQERTTEGWLKNLLFIAVFAGVGEELFFRGVIQRLLIRSTRNPWVGILLTAIIFSGFHMQFYGFLPRLFLGALLGAIYWYSGSLWVAILVHFLYDAVGVTLIHFNPQMLQNANETIIKGEWQLLLSAMVSLALTFVILQQMQKRSVASYEAVYNDDFPKQTDDFSF